MAHDKRFVRDAFAAIAPRYDLLNTLLSLGVDSIWRRRVVSLLDARDGEQVLDLCAGTLTVSRDIVKRSRSRPLVTSVDFCPEMLFLGRSRLRVGDADRIQPVCGDAESIPMKGEAFDAAVVTYGIRNLADVPRCLEEIHRVLKPEGRLVILDFLHPTLPGFAAFYRFYLEHILPWVGGVISGSRDAYKHLSDSIHGFMEPEELKQTVQAIRQVELAIGDGKRRLTAEEEQIKKLVRRSIVASADIPKGTIITEEMLVAKRPGIGIKPKHIEKVVGAMAKVDIKTDDAITWSAIEVKC